MNAKESFPIIIGLANFFIILFGACWAYWRFFREGSHRRRIEFRIECSFFGPHQGAYLTEFRLIAANRGLVKHKFPSIVLRVRGIKRMEPLDYWKGREPRVEFPTEVFKAEVVHAKYSYIFVEPGVQQVITFVTKIPTSYRFILARAEFHYNRYKPHSAESVFDVPQENLPNQSPDVDETQTK